MIRFLQTPGPLKKIILGGLLLIICGAMIITLVPGGIGSSLGLTGPGQGVVAKVADEDVTTVDVDRQARQMLQQQFPRGGAQTSALLPYFARQAAENLINQKAILVEARRLGLRVSDEEVRDELRKNPNFAQAFFPGGNFIGQEGYESLLQQHDLTVPLFEQSVKDGILFGKLRDLIGGSARIPETDIRREFARQNSKVKFDYAVLSREELEKSIHPTDTELKAYFDSNKAKYANSLPEKRKVKYVVIDSGKMDAAVTPQELEDYYHQHQNEFMVPEQVNVRQILIKAPQPGADGKVDPAALKAAHDKANDILKQASGGANFADLAKKYSEDPSSKNGGSLGWMDASRFPSPEVQAAARSLTKGATSNVISAGYAFVILHADDKQVAHLKTLAEVKDQIEPALKQQKATVAANAQATTLLTQARTGSLDKAAAAKGLQVVDTDLVTRTDSLPGIGSSPQFMAALFSEAEKSPPDVVQLPDGYAVFQLVEIKPPATPTFDEIRSRVETEFKTERVEALLSQKTQELSDRAKAEHDLKKAAKELNATLKTSDLVAPDGQVPDVGAMSGPAAVAFSMNPGETSGPISTAAGGVVLTVVQKEEPAEPDYAAKKDQIRDSLLQNKQNELFELFVSNLRQQMEKSGKIKINPDEYKNLTRQPGGAEGE